MSPDIRKALHDAAPAPTRHLDTERLARRGRSLRMRSRIFKGSLAVLIGLSIWAGSAAFEEPADVQIRPAEHQDGVDGSESKKATPVPQGKRHVVIEGTFEDGGKWGKHAGRNWRVVVTSFPDGTECWSLDVGSEFEDIGGTACTSLDNAPKAAIGARVYTPSGNFGNELAVVVGQVRPDVASVRFEFSDELVQTVTVDAIEPPQMMEADWDYYVAFLPGDRNGHIVALDDNGEELGRDRLCGGGCDGRDSQFVAGETEYSLDGLEITLELKAGSIVSGETLRSTLIVRNDSGHSITERDCAIAAGRYALVPVDDPDAELWLQPSVDCAGSFTFPDGFSDSWTGPSFSATTQNGEPLPAGEYIAVLEIEGFSERLQQPVEITQRN